MQSTDYVYFIMKNGNFNIQVLQQLTLVTESTVFETIINCFYARLTIFSTNRDLVIRVKMHIIRVCIYYNAG